MLLPAISKGFELLVLVCLVGAVGLEGDEVYWGL